jgi:multidrug resistance efflux pump
MKTTIFCLVLLATMGVVGGHLVLKAQNEPSSRPAVPPTPVAADQVAANGIVEGARPELGLRPEVAGILAVSHVRENQEVGQGDLLGELHNDTQQHQVALAQAEVALAQAQLERLRNGELPEKRRALAAIENAKRSVFEQAKAEAERSQRLSSSATSREQYDRDRLKMFVAQAELEQAAAERALVEAPARADEVAAAEARVAAAKARLRLAEAELAKTRLRAPSKGRILQIFAEPGEVVGPASPQPVLLLADLSQRRVRAFIEELDAAQVRVGQAAAVTTDALPNQEFRGKVAVVLPRMGKRAPQSDVPGEYKDLYFREVLIDLEAADELPLNLRVNTRITVTPREEQR